MNVLLISEKTLKEDSFLSENLSGDYIIPAIQTSQEIYLQELIGTKLYNKIIELVADGSIATDLEYKKLLDDYITPYLNYKVMAEIQLPISYKFKNLGMVQTTDENVQNTQIKDIQTISKFYDNRASFYANRLTKFLIANSQIYKEYNDCDSVADYKSNKNSFYCPILL